MPIFETKGLNADIELPKYTLKDISAHGTKGDAWMTIHGQDGLLSGRYLASLTVADEVEFRGPKGSMRYTTVLCRKIGMVAGGTGITPMYQLIRAICKTDTDTTEARMIYTNRASQTFS
ncbi:hypothetical protein N7457_009578 [Penicillium paradoxum]|uniref:uncharacterized protein n=1 Tax=Penicillium paradoxum TaxID=176176 RepID=UPI0025492D0F|nr:uncharacterized protein N7457_009578 [Penicillium paradoxum]KAJ5774682.1 hypothetical protein N7457_009578 [Penicillium paradoxum]